MPKQARVDIPCAGELDLFTEVLTPHEETPETEIDLDANVADDCAEVLEGDLVLSTSEETTCPW